MSSKLNQVKNYTLLCCSAIVLLSIGFLPPLASKFIDHSFSTSAREDISRDPNDHRNPASLIPPDLRSGKKFFPALEKVHPLVQVKINNQLQVPDSGDQEVLLEAWIKVNGDVKGEPIQFDWKLDPGIHVIDGEVSGEIPSLNNGEWKYFSLRVYGFSKESQKLAVMTASVLLDGNHIGQSSQYNSRAEDSFEYIAPTVQEQASLLDIKNARKGRLHR